MYRKTEYIMKYKGGHLDPINSNIALKQGCPLSPMLFNLYIDNVTEIFDKECDPVMCREKELNHFLYADDLVLLSLTEQGLQRCIDKLQIFAERKHLSVSIDKSKTMVFNRTGRLTKHRFNIKGNKLEHVQNFCYLGYELNCSGTNNFTINTLYDKAGKAMRPILSAIARFNIPVKVSIKLFNSYIAPIMLYNVENWGGLTENKINNFSLNNFMTESNNDKASNIHRKFLKYTLGVTKSCPNVAVLGDTGETPLMLKGYRLMLQYWHRINNLPNDTLVNMALLENIDLKSNWIATIENLINCFNLPNSLRNASKLRCDAKKNIHSIYVDYWKNNININRLEFYCKYKNKFEFEKYLNISKFEKRKRISKLRCSDHELEIEKGRHKKLPREARTCKLCIHGSIENEEHFLFECKFYDDIRRITKFGGTPDTLFEINTLDILGDYILHAIDKRRDKELLNHLFTNAILLYTE